MSIGSRLIIFVATATVVSSLAGCGSESSKAPITISFGQGVQDFPNMPYVAVQAVENGVSIESVQVNRGNCSTSVFGTLPMRLKFGESVTLGLISCNVNDVIEVSVVANNTPWRFAGSK
ncbi:MAG: hypothetical protein ACYC9L_06180 [Sulfuricaulis sp.]